MVELQVLFSYKLILQTYRVNLNASTFAWFVLIPLKFIIFRIVTSDNTKKGHLQNPEWRLTRVSAECRSKQNNQQHGVKTIILIEVSCQQKASSWVWTTSNGSEADMFPWVFLAYLNK